MTSDQYCKASDILTQINELNKAKDKLIDLLSRTDDITNGFSKTIEIRLAEQYIHTPIAKVDLIRFVDFINCEISAIDERVAKLNKEFEDI